MGLGDSEKGPEYPSRAERNARAASGPLVGQTPFYLNQEGGSYDLRAERKNKIRRDKKRGGPVIFLG